MSLILSYSSLSANSLRELKSQTKEHLKDFCSQIGPSQMIDLGSGAAPQLARPLHFFIKPHAQYQWHEKMTLSGSEILKLAASTKRDNRLYNETQEEGDIIISGQIYITHNDNGQPVEKTRYPITQISIAGINLAYSTDNFINFNGQRYNLTNDVDGYQYSTTSKGFTAASIKKYKEQMLKKWTAILDVFQENKVEVAVLPAIGLGAFLPYGFGANQLRQASIEALNISLDNRKFKKVILSIPKFDSDNYSAFSTNNIGSYEICRISMFDIAHSYAQKKKVGIVNPSDKEALVTGNLGQYWALDSDIALEEIFPYLTTILLNNTFYTQQKINIQVPYEPLSMKLKKSMKFIFPQ